MRWVWRSSYDNIYQCFPCKEDRKLTGNRKLVSSESHWRPGTKVIQVIYLQLGSISDSGLHKAGKSDLYLLQRHLNSN